MARKKAGVAQRNQLESERQPLPSPIISFLQRHSLPVSVALVLIGSLRIVATYTVFNHTFDEPAHIACGMEWLDNHVYQYETQHPPLARIATAIGPYLLGIRSQGTPNLDQLSKWKEGTAILYNGHHYDLTLAVARLGILPFFWIACVAVYWWGRRWFDPAVASLAVFLFSFLPPVLAHAGLATTDMAVTAFLSLAFVSALAWIEEPTMSRGLVFGLCGGLAILSKFSSLVFFPAAAVAALLWFCIAERPGTREMSRAVLARLPSLALAIGSACFLVWAGYRFSIGNVDFTSLRLPAPEFFAGIEQVRSHNAEGHSAYLLGEISQSGFWLFYPVALVVKTPLSFLLLVSAGIVAGFRHRRAWIPLAFSIGILLVGLFSRINIGVRHILPIYVGLSLVAGAEAVRLLGHAQKVRIVLAVLCAWFIGSSLLSHPDYLAYFNEAAGSEPEKVLVDSDLDWNQDLKRLSKRLKEVGATSVSIAGLPVIDLQGEHGFPPVSTYRVGIPNVGWNAVGFTFWKQRRLGLYDKSPEFTLWPDRVAPGERVGKSLMLWYFPPGKGAPN